jgi:integrase
VWRESVATIRTRIKADGSRTFHAQVRVQGFPSRTASFPTKRLAERWVTTVEAEMIEGRHFRNTESRRRTVSQAIDRYLVEELPKKKNGSLHRATLPWWSQRIGHLKLAAVTAEVIVDCRAELAAGKFVRAKPGSKRTSLKKGAVPNQFARSGSTVNRYLATLSHVFTVARKEWRWISGNPVTDVSKLREGKSRTKVLSDVELGRLTAATSANPTLHAFVVVAVSTAARAGELQRLTWTHVDLREGRITFVETKNSDARTAWLHGEAKHAVVTLAASHHEQNDRVFQNASKRGLFQYSKLFAQALVEAQIAGFTFHGLRHSAATYLARAGATQEQLKRIGGWRSNVVSRYVHLQADDTKAVTETMNKRIKAPGSNPSSEEGPA